ncbi:inositol hexakisphosphate/diphosphoinositol-pentakisphosphate kinase [Clonorchis sinensis]|uniref:Inositol hexakisphosphate and diphosphoinositol-pentakisphosphate kinase n=1 Tax=Clonorchis sinensis TaxID=79923 RepID=G7YCZ6_CLOSI|nr:inositol hexakisphosphate/diphosphoinositol-pentakisphosphate kinase [Clonorchis sinensis]
MVTVLKYSIIQETTPTKTVKEPFSRSRSGRYTPSQLPTSPPQIIGGRNCGSYNHCTTSTRFLTADDDEMRREHFDPRGIRDTTDACEPKSCLLLVVKWGGELTAAGRQQAERLGRAFRCIYPGGDGHYGKDPGLGLLRLHSTYRHDLKIYASDEGRVQMTAAAFAKGFLALEGELPPILVQMVKSANTNGLLDNDNDCRHYQHMVKRRIKDVMSKFTDFTEEDIEALVPTGAKSLVNAMRYVGNPRAACDRLLAYVKKLGARLLTLATCRESRNSINLYQGESWELLLRRWGKLWKDFRGTGDEYDLSKISDIYDNIKYDLQHNPAILVESEAQDFFMCAKSLADIVVPQAVLSMWLVRSQVFFFIHVEYGITKEEKLVIGQRICTPLMRKILSDARYTDVDECTRLHAGVAVNDDDEAKRRLCEDTVFNAIRFSDNILSLCKISITGIPEALFRFSSLDQRIVLACITLPLHVNVEIFHPSHPRTLVGWSTVCTQQDVVLCIIPSHVCTQCVAGIAQQFFQPRQRTALRSKCLTGTLNISITLYHNDMFGVVFGTAHNLLSFWMKSFIWWMSILTMDAFVLVKTELVNFAVVLASSLELRDPYSVYEGRQLAKADLAKCQASLINSRVPPKAVEFQTGVISMPQTSEFGKRFSGSTDLRSDYMFPQSNRTHAAGKENRPLLAVGSNGRFRALVTNYSKGVASPERFVRTRLYFTSESHLHSLLTCLRYGELTDICTDEQWRRAMDYVASVSEINYLAQIVIMIYEDPTVEPKTEQRFHVELHFSPGAFALCHDQLEGSGFRPGKLERLNSQASMVSSATSLGKGSCDSAHAHSFRPKDRDSLSSCPVTPGTPAASNCTSGSQLDRTSGSITHHCSHATCSASDVFEDEEVGLCEEKQAEQTSATGKPHAASTVDSTRPSSEGVSASHLPRIKRKDTSELLNTDHQPEAMQPVIVPTNNTAAPIKSIGIGRFVITRPVTDHELKLNSTHTKSAVALASDIEEPRDAHVAPLTASGGGLSVSVPRDHFPRSKLSNAHTSGRSAISCSPECCRYQTSMEITPPESVHSPEQSGNVSTSKQATNYSQPGRNSSPNQAISSDSAASLAKVRSGPLSKWLSEQAELVNGERSSTRSMLNGELLRRRHPPFRNRSQPRPVINFPTGSICPHMRVLALSADSVPSQLARLASRHDYSVTPASAANITQADSDLDRVPSLPDIQKPRISSVSGTTMCDAMMTYAGVLNDRMEDDALTNQALNAMTYPSHQASYNADLERLIRAVALGAPVARPFGRSLISTAVIRGSKDEGQASSSVPDIKRLMDDSAIAPPTLTPEQPCRNNQYQQPGLKEQLFPYRPTILLSVIRVVVRTERTGAQSRSYRLLSPLQGLMHSNFDVEFWLLSQLSSISADIFPTKSEDQLRDKIPVFPPYNRYGGDDQFFMDRYNFASFFVLNSVHLNAFLDVLLTPHLIDPLQQPNGK